MRSLPSKKQPAKKTVKKTAVRKAVESPTPRGPVNPVTPNKPTKPKAQGDRAPSKDVAVELLGEKFKAPGDIPTPDELPPGYDRMSEVAKANSARVRAFSGGLPDSWGTVPSSSVQ